MGHRQGILSSASLMVGAPAARDAVERARRLPNLHVGSTSPWWTPTPACLRGGARPAGSESRLRPISPPPVCASSSCGVRRELALEIRAQFESFRATGLLSTTSMPTTTCTPSDRGGTDRASRPGLRLKAVRVPAEPAESSPARATRLGICWATGSSDGGPGCCGRAFAARASPATITSSAWLDRFCHRGARASTDSPPAGRTQRALLPPGHHGRCFHPLRLSPTEELRASQAPPSPAVWPSTRSASSASAISPPRVREAFADRPRLLGLGLAICLVLWQGWSSVLSRLAAQGWAALDQPFPPRADGAQYARLAAPAAGSEAASVWMVRVDILGPRVGQRPLAGGAPGSEAVAARLMVKGGVRAGLSIASLVVRLTLTLVTQVVFTLLGSCSCCFAQPTMPPSCAWLSWCGDRRRPARSPRRTARRRRQAGIAGPTRSLCGPGRRPSQPR